MHLKTSMGAAYTDKDTPIYDYPLFTTRNFSNNAQNIWPAELLAATLYPGDVELGHYDYEKVSCPVAESYLKRAFWVRLNEANTPEHAEEIADTIADVFKKHGIASNP